MHTQTELRQIAEECATVAWARFCKIYPKLSGFTMPIFEISNRMTVTAGTCYWDDRKIKLSASLMIENMADFKRVIIPHELAHQVSFDLYGKDTDIHGPKWQGIMIAYGLPPDRCHSLENDHIRARAAAESAKIAARPVFIPEIGMRVCFIHRDRKRVETLVVGTVSKINLKTIKVLPETAYKGSYAEWTVSVDTLSLRKV